MMSPGTTNPEKKQIVDVLIWPIGKLWKLVLSQTYATATYIRKQTRAYIRSEIMSLERPKFETFGKFYKDDKTETYRRWISKN